MSWKSILKQEKISLYKGDLMNFHQYVISGEFKKHMAEQFDKEDSKHRGRIVGYTEGKGYGPQQPLFDETFTGVGLDDYVRHVEQAVKTLARLGFRGKQPMTVEFIFMPVDSVMANMEPTGFPTRSFGLYGRSREFQEINASEY